MKEILFIIIISVSVPDHTICYPTNPPRYGTKFDHYEAEIFYDKKTLTKFIKTNNCDGAILIDVKSGTQDTIRLKPIEGIKTETIIKGYEWLNPRD